MQKKFLKNCEGAINAAAGKVRIEYFPICLCVRVSVIMQVIIS